MPDGLSVFMSTDTKARMLLTNAWNHFWRHSADPSAYYEDYIDSDELDEVIAHVEKIIAGTD